MAPDRGLLRTAIRLGGHMRRAAVLFAAFAWRRLMFRTTFIAITGSVGKTTCKEAIAAVLASRFPTMKTRGGRNSHNGIARTIWSVRPWHRYAVIEIGIDAPGQMARLARAVRPDIVVWVSVARTHTVNFRTLDEIAREKSRLVSQLGPGGIAILNDDYPHIAGYSPPSEVKTVYFGGSARSRCTVSDVSSRWPERLSFNARCGELSVHVKTRFVGEHWVASFAPALIVAGIAGIPLDEAAAALAVLEPQPQRLSVVDIAGGPTFLRDRNASVDSIGPALRILENATAKRRILVMTDVTDSPRKPRRRLRHFGREAARVADAVVFIGDHCGYGVAGAVEGGIPADQAWQFYNIADAAAHLRRELRAGDLVLLRGRRLDHLDRLYLTMTSEVECWRIRCPKHTECSACSELKKPRQRSRSSRLGGADPTFEEDPEMNAQVTS